jgi:putative membrane protein (TIGR04086 family)
LIRTIDWRAVGAGVVAALVLALPAALIGAVVVTDESNNGVFVFFLVIMAGMLVGGFVAGSKRPDSPLTHGAVAAVLGYLAAQTVTVLVRVVDGSKLRSPVVYVFNALLMASLGVVGGLVAERRNARLESST